MSPVTRDKLIVLILSLLSVMALVSQTTMAEAPPRQRQAELIDMVKHDCGSCHGLTLKGGLGPPLTTEALTNKPHTLLFNTIMSGRENTAMPPWEGMLTQEEIDWLITLLKKGVDSETGEGNK